MLLNMRKHEMIISEENPILQGTEIEFYTLQDKVRPRER